MYPDPQRLEDLSSIRDAMRQISQEAQAVVELLDLRLENEHLDGKTEAEDVRSVLELIQSLTLEVSEEIDAYQERGVVFVAGWDSYGVFRPPAPILLQ